MHGPFVCSSTFQVFSEITGLIQLTYNEDILTAMHEQTLFNSVIQHWSDHKKSDPCLPCLSFCNNMVHTSLGTQMVLFKLQDKYS